MKWYDGSLAGGGAGQKKVGGQEGNAGQDGGQSHTHVLTS